MKNLILAILMGLMAFTAKAQTTAEAEAIQGVVTSQIEAMKADDWETAFSYASPTIQRVFRDQYIFSDMVMKGYNMVARPHSYETGGLYQRPAGPSQIMFFNDMSGRRYIAEYKMQLVDGKWRINGVEVRLMPDQAA
ncbi:MAG: DUF4864 domain-containing protein [Pikeienuella sp.]